MIDQPSEYLPANNANDKRVIPMHAPIPGVDMTYAVALHNRAMANYARCRELAEEAYQNCDPDGVEYFKMQSEDYLAAALNCSTFICDIIRIRSN